MQIMRGFAQTVDWVIEETAGVPLDINARFNAARVCFDEAKGAVDQLAIECEILQVGTGDAATDMGTVRFELVEADTVGWDGDKRIRHQFELRRTADSEWCGCLADPVVVHDRVRDAT